MMKFPSVTVLSLGLGLIFKSVYASSDRFPGVDLWMPTSYQYHYLALLDAAEKVKVEPYCDEMISGRLLESKSTKDHPIFYFRCRTAERKLFSLHVDGKTMEIKNTYLEKQREKEVRAKAAAEKKEAERVQAIREAQKQYWGVCRKQLKKRLKLFNGVNIVSALPPEPEYLSEEELLYSIDFDALNPAKKALHYRANCKIKGIEDFSVKLKVRRDK